jgi:hypothetical protein
MLLTLLSPQVGVVAYIKVAGTWQTATVFIKVAGTWQPATPFFKDTGTWK